MVALVTLPVFNERQRISNALAALDSGLRAAGIDFRLAIAEDGSVDGTKGELDALLARFPSIEIRTVPSRQGRGSALTSLWRGVPAEEYCYVDVDLPAGVDGVVRALQALHDGADMAVGSRYCAGARCVRPPLVRQASLTYNWFVRTAFDDRVTDHQCGLKAFRKDALAMLLARARAPHWFWDTEVIILARRLGLTVQEIPLHWVERRYQRTSLKRIGQEVPYFFRNVLAMKERLANGWNEELFVADPA